MRSGIFSLKKILLLLLVSVASIGIGMGFGGMIGGFSNSTAIPAYSTPVNQGAPTPALKSWSGTIYKVFESDLIAKGGEFKLVDSNNNPVAVLQSTKIDLRFLEGMSVAVEGRRLRSLEGNLPLILVDKVKFK